MKYLYSAFFAIILLQPALALADCANPSEPTGISPRGAVVYNGDYTTFQYCDGNAWIAMHGDPAAGNPTGCNNIGDQCNGGEFDGLYFIGNVGGNDIYAAESDESGTYAWGGNGQDDSAAGSLTDGLANTNVLLADGHSHAAAQACRDRGPEWYLPSKDELDLLWNNGSPVAGVGTDHQDIYWSSTENGIYVAWSHRFMDGDQYPDDHKINSHPVRCVRRDSGCTDPVGVEGEILYNKARRVLQGCAGYQWLAFAVGQDQPDWSAAIGAGTNHSCALETDGSLSCWGRNDYGQGTPPAGTDYAAVAGGYQHSCALKANGSLACWGRDNYGQSAPPAGTDYMAVTAGSYHSCALKTDGSLVCWGYNGFDESSPPGGTDYVALDAGGYHSCALKADGSLACWGRDNYSKTTPPAGTNYTAVAGGGDHSCALKADGSLACWGDDGDGQSTPPTGTDYAAVTAGEYHSCALKTNGSIVCWGEDASGQSTPPAGTDYEAVAAGGYYNCALKSDGSIICWGWNNYGQTSSPSGGNFGSPPGSCTGPDSPAGGLLYNQAHSVMQYCNGASWMAIGMYAQGSGESGPTGCDNVGDVCGDGTVYAGLSPDGDVEMYTTPGDAGAVPWSNGNTTGYTTTNQTSATDGASNTANLVTMDSDSSTGGIQPHQAAKLCADLDAHGHTDWYLPARDELDVLFTNRAAIGYFDTSGADPTGIYWSSTEASIYNAWEQIFSDGDQNSPNKWYDGAVRCVRKQ